MDTIFHILHQDAQSLARCGTLSLAHGMVQTPAFMPVGTNGTVKGIYHEKVASIGYHLILANTYHLYLRPGMDVLAQFGGLHRFCNWHGNILTDSGGFQIFSLSQLRKIKEEGVTFQSHIDGSHHHLRPEDVVDIQRVINSDILMCLDVCTPPGISYREAQEAERITRSWAKRSLERWKSQEGAGKLFGIVQGNFYKDLRKESAEAITAMDFPGIAIGGLSVGEERAEFSEFLAYTAQLLPREKPHYVMGIGSPDYLLDAVANGIDLFDCVLATRTARNGSVFTDDGMIQLKKAIHTYDDGPLNQQCPCTACTQYSRAYLHHLFKTGEMLGGMLATEHNLTYLYLFMDEIRASIRENRFSSFRKQYLERYYDRSS